jgi:hypothetical protein
MAATCDELKPARRATRQISGGNTGRGDLLTQPPETPLGIDPLYGLR